MEAKGMATLIAAQHISEGDAAVVGENVTIRSSAEIPPVPGMRVRFARELSGEPSENALEYTLAFTPNMATLSARWDAGCYDILEMPARELEPFDFSTIYRANYGTPAGGVFAPDAVVKLTGDVTALDKPRPMELLCNRCGAPTKSGRAYCGTVCAAKSGDPKLGHVIDAAYPEVEPAPWKCASARCLTPTAGPSPRVNAGVICVACADVHAARLMRGWDENVAMREKPKPEPAYVPPGEPTMGGSWRSGGALWRPTGGGR